MAGLPLPGTMRLRGPGGGLQNVVQDYGWLVINGLMAGGGALANQIMQRPAQSLTGLGGVGYLAYNKIFGSEAPQEVLGIRQQALKTLEQTTGRTVEELKKIVENTETKEVLKGLTKEMSEEIHNKQSVSSFMAQMRGEESGRECGPGGCKITKGKAKGSQYSYIDPLRDSNWQCFSAPVPDRYGAIKIQSKCVKKRPKILTSEEKNQLSKKDRYLRQMKKLMKYDSMNKRKILNCNIKELEKVQKLEHQLSKRVFDGHNGQKQSGTRQYIVRRIK